MAIRLSFIVFLGALMGVQTVGGSGHTFVETARHQDWPANATRGTTSDPHVLNPFARPQFSRNMEAGGLRVLTAEPKLNSRHIETSDQACCCVDTPYWVSFLSKFLGSN